MTSASKIALVACLVLPGFSFQHSVAAADKSTPEDIFEERIMPIFKSKNPSSCVQCHLSAVDLKDYILPSPERTFASLKAQGLVDLENPEKSKILELIRMGDRDLDAGAKLLHEKTRRAEYSAFADWIKSCCKDPVLSKIAKPKAADLAKPSSADPVIRHARKSRVVDSFARNIWSQRMRCFPCHTPHELDEKNPKHRRPIERVAEFELQYGKAHAQRLRLFKETPEATLRYWIERSRETPGGDFPLINTKDARHSLILLKPTSRLPEKLGIGRKKPSNAAPVSHMGGLKMHVDDQSYKAFVAWLEDYAKVVGDGYRSIEELPADNWYPSKHVVVVQDAPKSWPDGVRVQLQVHAWDEGRGAWREDPIAFAQNSVNPRRRMVGVLFLLRPKDAKDWDAEEATLPPGKYLLKSFVDAKERLKKDPTVLLGAKDYFGQTVVHGAWTKTFRNSRKIVGKRFEK